jgi:hypothetical protein
VITVEVPIQGRPYDVLVGHGARRELAALLPRSAKRAAIVTQPGVPLELASKILTFARRAVCRIPRALERRRYVTPGVSELAAAFAS